MVISNKDRFTYISNHTNLHAPMILIPVTIDKINFFVIFAFPSQKKIQKVFNVD